MKKTTLIVDGYNAINAIPEAKNKLKESLLSARSAIIMITEKYVKASGYIDDFCVVFDGQDKYRERELEEMPHDKGHIFSDSGDGDEKIIDMIRKYSDEGRVVVASNDNYIKNMARGFRALSIDSEDLMEKQRSKEAKRQEKEQSKEKKIGRREKSKITEEYKRELGL